MYPFLRLPLIQLSSALLKPRNYKSMELFDVVKALETVAPTKYAESWDNVGLLLEPKRRSVIKRVFLTNDLTEPVLKEALTLGDVGMILSYHPPIFQSFKRLTQSTAKERIILECAALGIAVYSPHTSLDNIDGGINDWLLKGVGEGRLVSIGARRMGRSLANVVRLEGIDERSLAKTCDPFPSVFIKNNEVYCSDRDLVNLLPSLRELAPNNFTVNTNTNVTVAPSGGKLLELSQGITITEAIQRVKSHLNLSHIRVATGNKDRLIKTIATCAGSGGSVLQGVGADLYLTGEMSHHQVLEATSRGTDVILCEHTNTERGYLRTVYKDLVSSALPGVEIKYSQVDKDPLEVA